MTLRRRRPDKRSFALLVIMLCVYTGLQARAQTSIFNVPTTDVLPPQKVTVEVDYITHPTPYDRGGFHYFGPLVVYGLRKNVEVGVNFYYTKSADPDEAEIQPNIKWQLYSSEESGFAAAVGGILFVPLKNREETNTKAMLYTTLSQQVKKKFGPRITAGAYTFVGRMDEGETRGGVMLGLEQPLYKKLSFISDWFSGYNDYGYATGGFGLDLPRNSYLYAGYAFGNRGRGNNWLGIFLGRTF